MFMNQQECNTVLYLLKDSQDVDKQIETFSKVMQAATVDQSTAVPGVALLPAANASEIFRIRVHARIVAAVYAQLREKDTLIGRVAFCVLKPNDAIGEILLPLTVRGNGEVEFPDAENLDLHDIPAGKYDAARRMVFLQVAKAVQGVLPKVD
jgi:hypothetical protein